MKLLKHIASANVVVVLAAVSAACNGSAAEREMEARQAQLKAYDEAAQARAQVEERAAKEQAAANDESREAVRALTDEKAAFRRDKQKELDDLNGKIDDIRTKARSLGTDVKADVAAALDEIEKRKAEVDAELSALEASSALELEKVNDRVEERISQFKRSVSEAQKRI
jgi:hypothetical protein